MGVKNIAWQSNFLSNVPNFSHNITEQFFQADLICFIVNHIRNCLPISLNIKRIN